MHAALLLEDLLTGPGTTSAHPTEGQPGVRILRCVCAHLFVPGYPGPLKELQASSNPVKVSISEVMATLKGFVQTGLSREVS